MKEAAKLRKLGADLFKTIAKATGNLLEAKTILQVFPMILNKQSSKVKVKDLTREGISKADEMKVYGELMDLFADESIEDTAEILRALIGKIQEYQTVEETNMRLENIKLKGFNEDVKETKTKTEESTS